MMGACAATEVAENPGLQGKDLRPTFQLEAALAHSNGDAPGRLDGRSRHARLQDAGLSEMADDGICLSMHQPWASLLVYGIKMHEGRVWSSAHRGRLWIAAASKVPPGRACRGPLRVFFPPPHLPCCGACSLHQKKRFGAWKSTTAGSTAATCPSRPSIQPPACWVREAGRWVAALFPRLAFGDAAFCPGGRRPAGRLRGCGRRAAAGGVPHAVPARGFGEPVCVRLQEPASAACSLSGQGTFLPCGRQASTLPPPDGACGSLARSAMLCAASVQGQHKLWKLQRSMHDAAKKGLRRVDMTWAEGLAAAAPAADGASESDDDRME